MEHLFLLFRAVLCQMFILVYVSFVVFPI